MTESRFRRVVLKLSGEAFADTSISFGIDADLVGSRTASSNWRAINSWGAHSCRVGRPHGQPHDVSRASVPARIFCG